MLKKLFLFLLVVIIMLTTPGPGYRGTGWPLAAPVERADIVVYGGGLAGCAAAWKAALTAPQSRVVMVIPYPERKYGGLATVGGQNFWDLRYWSRDGSLAQAGSFASWFGVLGPFYSPDDLALMIAGDLGSLPNLITYWSMDISAVYRDGQGLIKAVALQSLKREASGEVAWSDGRLVIAASIFIDASEDGRLSRLAGAGVTTGREDWPAVHLEDDYVNNRLAPRQQAATLMFKVTGVKPGRYDDMVFKKSRGVWGAYGGKEVYINDPVLTAFNDRYGPQGFALKPLNAAQDGPGSPDWWVNALLVFNVDGRACSRDRQHDTYPRLTVPGALDTDTAWQKARVFLENPDFISALRRFHGFEEARLVRDDRGQPVTGSMLYLRETVHTTVNPLRAGSGTDNSNYAVTTAAVYGAGPGPGDGEDAGYYVNRIGLGFYWQDVNAYLYPDLKGPDGRYRWPVTSYLRPDYPLTEPGPSSLPQNPVYIPFNVLLSRPVLNLLIPGYAACMSSLAWASLRVLPNQCVLGDAAGVAAAHAVLNGRLPGEFTDRDVEAVRRILVERFNARVDK